MPPKESLDIGRRSWLKTIGASAVGVAAVGGTVAADQGEYDKVVNVAEEGAARDASEPINDILEEHRGDSVLFEFPEGEYLMNRKFRHTGFEKVGIVGENASIVPAPADEFESESVLFKLGTYYEPGGKVTVKDLTFDFTADNTGARGLQVQSNDMHVKNVTFTGYHDTGTWGPAQFDVIDPDTTAVVENVRMPDGGAFTGNTAQDGDPTVDTGPTGMLVSPYHDGTLVFRDCVVGPFPDNGLYDSSEGGCVIVDGGTYRNSNVANIRLAGDGCAVKNASIVVDENRDKDVNQRGIRLDGGEGYTISDTDIVLSKPNGEAIRITHQTGTSTLERNDIRLDDTSTSNDAIDVSGDAGKTTMSDCTIEINCPGQALHFRSGDGDPVVADGVTVTGDATGDIGGRHAIICDRDGSELRNFAVDQPGPGYRRALKITGDDVTVSGGRYHSTHHPIVNDASGTHIEGVTAWAEGETEAAKFYAENANVDLLNSTLYDGIIDYGTEDFTTRGNEYPEGKPDQGAVEGRETETESSGTEAETESSGTEAETESSGTETETKSSETETSTPESTETESNTPQETSTSRSTETQTSTRKTSTSSNQSSGTSTTATSDDSSC